MTLTTCTDGKITPTTIVGAINDLETIANDTNEPSGFIREDTATMGIMEFSPDGTTVYQIDEDGAFTSSTPATFGDGSALAARKFVIYPVTTDFDIYVEGTKSTITTTKTVTLADTSGLQFIYFSDATTLASATTLSTDFFEETPIVSFVYWNAVTSDCILFADERHGVTMDGITHRYMHFTSGAKYVSGMGLNTMTEDGTTHGQVDSGVYWDEDIMGEPSAQTNLPFWYLNGATSGVWTDVTADNNLGHIDGADTYISYNQDTGTTWQLTELSSVNHNIINFIVLTNNKVNPYVKIIGQTLYTSINSAREGISDEVSNIITTGLPTPEFVFVAAYIVDRNGELQTLGDGSTYLDLREVSTSSTGGASGTVTDHLNLLNIGTLTHDELEALMLVDNDQNVITLTDDVADTAYSGLKIDHNISGADALTASRIHATIEVDTDSSATGGDTTNEHRVHGIYNTVAVTGDSDIVYGDYNYVSNSISAGTCSALAASYNYLLASNSGGAVTNAYGSYGYCVDNGAGTVGNIYGLYGRALKSASSTTTTANIKGITGEVEVSDGAGVITSARAIEAIIDNNVVTSPEDAITYASLFYGSFQGTLPTTSYGVYIASDVTSYFVGDVKTESQLLSTVATGTAPLAVSSTTVCTNLNADKVDGLDGTQFIRSDEEDTVVYTDSTGDANFTGLSIDHNMSGSDTLTGDRAHTSLRIDVDSSASGGDTTNEHRVYGINTTVDVTGDSDLVYGDYTTMTASHASGTISTLCSSWNVTNSSGTSTSIVSNAYGAYNQASDWNAGVSTNVIGAWNRAYKAATSTGTTAVMKGMTSEIETNEGAGVITNAKVCEAIFDNNVTTSPESAAGTAYLFYGQYAGTIPTTSYGVFISSDVPNYFGGDLDVQGDVVEMPNLPTSDPTNAGQLWNDAGTLKISAG